MALRRFDSLFARLFLLQLGVALALIVILGALVYVERNVAVARLVAERWAPALREASGARAESPVAATPRRVLPVAALPPLALPTGLRSPRMAALREELARHGLVLLDVSVGGAGGARTGPGAMVWLRLRGADGAERWYGINDTALVPRLPGRLLIALVLMALLLAAVSWFVTRRLTRPLEQLRARMAAHTPGSPAAPPPPVEAAASPEVAAIQSAYDELLARYERHERERSLLLAGVSHDLRSPLARIRMAAGLLPEGDAAIAPRRESIVRNVEAADRLIGSFLDHVRAQELPLDETADLAAIARGVAQRAERPAGELAVDAPAALPLARVNALLLERLVANLVENALKHGRAPVTLRVAAEAGGGALVEVVDAGPGPDPARRGALMEAFARGDASRGTPGTGLGLAIVSRIAGRLGGTVTMADVPGGFAVRVRLPGRQPPAG